MSGPNYDPAVFASAEEAARVMADQDQMFGMPDRPYADNALGQRLNAIHAESERRRNDEFGWSRSGVGGFARRQSRNL